MKWTDTHPDLSVVPTQMESLQTIGWTLCPSQPVCSKTLKLTGWDQPAHWWRQKELWHFAGQKMKAIRSCVRHDRWNQHSNHAPTLYGQEHTHKWEKSSVRGSMGLSQSGSCWTKATTLPCKEWTGTEHGEKHSTERWGPNVHQHHYNEQGFCFVVSREPSLSSSFGMEPRSKFKVMSRTSAEHKCPISE